MPFDMDASLVESSLFAPLVEDLFEPKHSRVAIAKLILQRLAFCALCLVLLFYLLGLNLDRPIVWQPQHIVEGPPDVLSSL